jgi:hypothetical protein
LLKSFSGCWGPTTQDLQDTLQELKDSLYREGFLVDGEMKVEECEIEEEYHPPFCKRIT